ncbi:MAG: hypothetical protein DME70_03430, partial [Verrucomicrobia bacterium]
MISNPRTAYTVTNEPHLSILKQGVEVWNRWYSRQATAELRTADFSGSDLRGMDFSGVNLTGANLRNAKLAGAN